MTAAEQARRNDIKVGIKGGFEWLFVVPFEQQAPR